MNLRIEKMFRMRKQNEVGNYKVDFERNEVKGSNPASAPIKLERRLMDLLFIFSKRPNTVITREELVGSIWGNYGSGDKLLTHSISLLRKSLPDLQIDTIPTVGYQLNIPGNATVLQSKIINYAKPIFYLIIAAFILKMMLFPHH